MNTRRQILHLAGGLGLASLPERSLPASYSCKPYPYPYKRAWLGTLQQV